MRIVLANEGSADGGVLQTGPVPCLGKLHPGGLHPKLRTFWKAILRGLQEWSSLRTLHDGMEYSQGIEVL